VLVLYCELCNVRDSGDCGSQGCLVAIVVIGCFCFFNCDGGAWCKVVGLMLLFVDNHGCLDGS